MAASPLAAALLGGNEGGANMASFLDPAMAQAMPDIQLGQSLMQQGLSGAPASPWQALGRLAQTAAGTYLTQSGRSDLAKLYAHATDNAAATLPEGHPLRAALLSSDPIVRMQGFQAYQKALTLMSEPSNLSPGQNRYVGSAQVSGNNRPRSPEGVLQEDLNNAGGQAPSAPTAMASPAARGNAPVPLGPPRVSGTTIGDVIGGGTSNPPPLTGPQFNDRFSGAQRPGAMPTNPLQGAIDTKAAMAGAEEAAKNPALIERAGAVEAAKNPALIDRAGGVKQAEANVEYGDLIKPQAAPPKGPGGTETLPTTHGTLIPALTDQSPLPKTPAEAKPRVEAWQKTQEGWNSGLQPGYQAEQRLNTIAGVFKTMQTGYGAEQKAHVASMLKSIGVNLPESVLGDPAKVETAIHENYVETLQQLKASTPRFTQMEFRALSENKEHPDLQPAANLQMLSEDIAQLRQARDLPRDFAIAQQHGWRDPNSFEQAWLRQNPLHGYVNNVRKEIGPLKGMPGNETSGKVAAAPGPSLEPRINSQAEYDKLAKGARYVAPDGNTYIKGQ